jgi:hypothetical protein
MVDEEIVAGRIRRDGDDPFPNTRAELLKTKKGKRQTASV